MVAPYYTAGQQQVRHLPLVLSCRRGCPLSEIPDFESAVVSAWASKGRDGDRHKYGWTYDRDGLTSGGVLSHAYTGPRHALASPVHMHEVFQ